MKEIPKVTDLVIKSDLISLFADIYVKCFPVDWSGPAGRKDAISMYIVAEAMTNATDGSVVVCKQVVDSGLYRNILKYLNDPKLHSDRLNSTDIQTYALPLINILYNVVQVGTHLCSILSRSAFSVLQRFDASGYSVSIRNR